MSEGVSLVLGGTKGLGAEIAKDLRQRGEEVLVTGRSYSPDQHRQGFEVDLASYTEVEMLRSELAGLAIKRFFWVAGAGYLGDFAKQPDVHEMVDANFANVVPIAQTVWQKMIADEAEHNFVVVSSTSGVRARKEEAVYAATKHAQVGFTRSLGLESERLGSNIKVSLLLPSGMKTPFWDADRPPVYDEFLDPAKVAGALVKRVVDQRESFIEEMFERGDPTLR